MGTGSKIRGNLRHWCLVAFAACTWNASAQSGPEQVGVVRLPAEPAPHWVWVNDISFARPEAGRAALVDGDTGRYLGWLSTGVFFLALTLPADYRAIYSVETYYSRGVRGERSDIVNIYDPETLLPEGEIPIPPKRGAGMPTGMHASITDDDRFLLVYNFAPSQSVSVVDLAVRRFLREIETAGCVLVYPDGPRRFHMLCGDGSVLLIDLDDQGRATRKLRAPGFFDPRGDPIQEEAVRAGGRWLYVSYGGHVYSLDATGDEPRFATPWPLLRAQDRAASWRTGGAQLAAIHEPGNQLFVLMHQGGENSQEEPGTEVWVYDLESKERLRRIVLRTPATSIAVSTDPHPLLFSVQAERTDLDIYDAASGAHLRTVTDVAAFPTVLQTPWRGGRRP